MINQPLFYETMDALLLSSFSCQVVSDSATLWTTVMARPPCPLLSPRVCPKSCPLNQWCHPTISSSVIPFPSCLQSFPASGSLQMSQFFHQLAKVLEFQLQDQSFQWIFSTDFFRIHWLDLLAVQGTLKSLHQHYSSKASTLLHS